MTTFSGADLIRFWMKVHKTETCWLWIAGLDSDGYGGFFYEGKTYKAHRITWFLTHGVMPELDVLHQCDIPQCVNPGHLFLGTCQDNMADCLSKGRFAKGEKHVRAKVSDEDVQKIRFKVALGLTCKEVGKQFGLGSSQVHRICKHMSRRS